ncbi:MAG: PDZ domain-containing protein [Candidatus Omnitrophica bacterium]|nr:PDZ domain-containing protein [Candidatus Omnitrophota bacterium]
MTPLMKYPFHFLLISVLLSVLPVAVEGKAVDAPAAAASLSAPRSVREQCLVYFEELYRTMDENYFFDIRRADYDRFIKSFDEKILPSLLLEGKSSDYVRWRSTAYLLDYLKQPDDVFSRFLPPVPAEKFAQEVYGQKIDLGVEGRMEAPGFVVNFIEPRSDAYALGLRENDLIVRLDGTEVLKLGEERARAALVPLAGARVQIDFIDAVARKPHIIAPVSKEYFKQTVFLRETGVPDVYCLDIQKFNRETNEDMSRFLPVIAAKKPRGLVIDLRNNPGGPPLAALMVSAFFLPNEELFAYFEGRHKPRSELVIPRLPDEFHYDWPLVILVNSGTGSASELFSGVMQARQRAIVVGRDTAGQVLLKSIFNMSDGSSVAMVVARGHFPDGRPFPFDGVKPNEYVPDDIPADKMIGNAAKYLLLKAEGRL